MQDQSLLLNKSRIPYRIKNSTKELLSIQLAQANDSTQLGLFNIIALVLLAVSLLDM